MRNRDNANVNNDRYRQVFDLSSQAQLILKKDPPYNIVDANRQFITLYNCNKKDIIGKPLPFQSLLNHLDAGQGNENPGPLFFTINKDSEQLGEVVLKASFAAGEGIYLVSLRESENDAYELHSLILKQRYMLRDTHYRIKNSLQIISSLLHMQGLVNGSREFSNLMLANETRINLISKIHELIYESDDLKNIDLRQYFRILIHLLTEAYESDQYGIEIRFDVDSVPIDIDHAIPLGLIVNELVSNALKYAYPEETGILELHAHIKEDRYLYVQIKDSGCGFPDYIDPEQPLSLGLQLVQSLSGQLEGQLIFSRNEGTDIHFKMPYTSTLH